MRVYFDTTPYRASHLREPRGRGSWAFEFEGYRDRDILWSPSMTYTEAKKWAVEEVKRRDALRTLPPPIAATAYAGVTLRVLS